MSSDLVKLAVEIITLRRPLERMPLEMAKAFLADNNTPGSMVYYAVLRVLGSTAVAWEPESIWLGLKDNGVEMNEAMRNKYMAASTLIQNPAFYWDMHIFEDTCLAFNEAPVLVDILQEASPAQLAWGVYETEAFLRQNDVDPDFDYEPAKYTAAALHREGFVIAPGLLAFAQEELDQFNRGGHELKADILERWNRVDADKLHELKLEETPVDVQVGKLAAVQLYVDQRAANYNRLLQRVMR